MSNNDNGYESIKDFFEQQEEERKMREAEAEIRYADRRAEKAERRRRIESAAMKVCDMVDDISKKGEAERRPEDIVSVAAALNHIAVAMHAAENYAESRPYPSTGFGLGRVG